MASADALVHGCEAETFGLVVAEARASGTTVIAPDRGGAFEQVQLGLGLSYSAGNSADLARALRLFDDLRSLERLEPRSPFPKPRKMHDHFRELFAFYGKLASPPPLRRVA
jgi:alpha-1,6-mannosyltransferase